MLESTPFSRRFDRPMPVRSSPPSAMPPDIVSNRSPTDDDGALGKRIKHLRRGQGFTQKQLAERVGVTGAQFHRYETGTTRVAASRLIAIASALGVKPATLMNEAPAPVVRVLAEESPAPEADELVDLVELFSALPDRRRRDAVLSFVRSMTSRPQMAEAAE